MKGKLRRVLPLLHTLVEERDGERRFSPTHPVLHEPAVWVFFLNLNLAPNPYGRGRRD
jgi:hypothetical protein